MTSDVTFLIHDGFQILDLAGPMAAFQMAGRIAGTEPYRLHVSAPGGGVISSSAGVSVAAEAAPPVRGGTLIVVGGTAPGGAPPELLRSLGDALAASGRIASVCTGAFLLAEAGILGTAVGLAMRGYALMDGGRAAEVTGGHDRPVILDAGAGGGHYLRAAVEASGAPFEDHVTPGHGHLFADPDLPGYDEAATGATVERIDGFLR